MLCPLTERGKGAAADSNVEGLGLVATIILRAGHEQDMGMQRRVVEDLCLRPSRFGTDPDSVVRPG